MLLNIKYHVFDISDVNECNTTNGGCHSNANCINSAGTHICVCKPGFDGNGTICIGMYFNLFSLCFHIKEIKLISYIFCFIT